jgi:hypothetical protein
MNEAEQMAVASVHGHKKADKNSGAVGVESTQPQTNPNSGVMKSMRPASRIRM